METIKRDPRGQGGEGEISAFIWLRSQGLPVFVPLGHSRDVDLMSVIDDRPVRIQVKTSSVWRNRRWNVSVCTRGGNRSWTGITKRLNPADYDYLFVLVGDGRQWFIPSKNVDGGCGLNLGGPKYADFEIEAGQPLRNYRPSLH